MTGDGIEAECKNGILRLAIKKPAAAKPTKIAISDGVSKPKWLFRNLVGESKAKEQVTVKQTRDQHEPMTMAN